MDIGTKIELRASAKGFIDGNFDRPTPIPEGAILTLLEYDGRETLAEWNDAPKELGGRVVYYGPIGSLDYRRISIDLPPRID